MQTLLLLFADFRYFQHSLSILNIVHGAFGATPAKDEWMVAIEETNTKTAAMQSSPKRRVPHRLRVDQEREDLFMERMQVTIDSCLSVRSTHSAAAP